MHERSCVLKFSLISLSGLLKSHVRKQTIPHSTTASSFKKSKSENLICTFIIYKYFMHLYKYIFVTLQLLLHFSFLWMYTDTKTVWWLVWRQKTQPVILFSSYKYLCLWCCVDPSTGIEPNPEYVLGQLQCLRDWMWWAGWRFGSSGTV